MRVLKVEEHPKKRLLKVRYPNSAEEIDSVIPISKCKPFPLSTCYDSNLAHDRVARRSIGYVVGMVEKNILVMSQGEKRSCKSQLVALN